MSIIEQLLSREELDLPAKQRVANWLTHRVMSMTLAVGTKCLVPPTSNP